MLRALVLAGNYNPGGQVSEAHRRVGLVDVLTAGATGTVGIDSQVFRADVHLDGLIDVRVNEHRRERGVAARVCVKRGDAHQAVDAGFGLQIAIGTRPLDGERGTFYSTAFARHVVHHIDLVSFPFSPT